MRMLVSPAAGSNSWVNVNTHPTIADAINTFRAQGMQVLATHLSDKAVDFREIDYTQPTCIIMGQEKPVYHQKLSRWPIKISLYR